MAKPTTEEIEYRLKSSLGAITSAWIEGITPYLVRNLENPTEPSDEPLETLELKVYRHKIVPLPGPSLLPASNKRIDWEANRLREFLSLLQ